MAYFLRRTVSGAFTILLLFPLYFSLITFSTVQAQDVQEKWEARYGAIYSTNELGARVASDAQGNVYVAGNSFNADRDALNRPDAIMIVKYDAVEEQVWNKRFVAPNPFWLSDVFVDSTGVYVAGVTEPGSIRSILFLVKFDASSGEILWSANQGPGKYSTGVKALADNKGGIFVVGSVNISAPGDVSFLSKYDATSGELLWEQNLSIPGEATAYEHLADIALDARGDVILAGTKGSREGAGRVLTTKRSSQTGSLIWRQVHDTDLQEQALKIATDRTGGVYTLGVGYQDVVEEPDHAFLIKYDAATGNQVWMQQIESTDLPQQLIADERGGVYFVNTAQINRYMAATGALIWTQSFEGSLSALDVDAAGNLYAAGTQTGADYVARRYDVRTGAVAWQELATWSGGVEERITGISATEAGIVHLVGDFEVPANRVLKMFVATHQADTGQLVNRTNFQGTRLSDDRPIAITTDRGGYVYVAGTVGRDVATNAAEDIIVLKYSPLGEEVWGRVHGNRFRDDVKSIAVDDAGNVYVMGTVTGSDSRPDIVLLKLSGRTGGVYWETIHGPGQANTGKEMKLDKQGNIYITGTATSMLDVRFEDFIIKIDPETGESIWAKGYSPYHAITDLFEVASFALDEAGDVYVTGTIGAPGVANNLVVVKYAGSDGSIAWLKTYNSRNRQTAHYPTGITVDTTGGLYLAAYNDMGTGALESYLLKYRASDGELLWLQPSIDQGTTPGRLDNLIVDNAGGAYVTGFINGVPHVIKFGMEQPGVLWTAPYEGIISEIELDYTGGIYATGLADGNMHTVKYRAANGDKVWDVVKEGPSEVALLTLDVDRNVFVAGTVFEPSTNYDILTVKYSQGEELCHEPVQVQLYLHPFAIRAGWQVRTTADFGSFILSEPTGVRWTWGDGTAPSISYTAFGTSRITGQHTYQRAGIYKVGLDFSESCLAPANEGYEQWQVIYDPEAGHVVGAGWQNSPQAAHPWMATAGRLHFAFGARYSNRHATSPQGHLLLLLGNRELLRSSSMEWLVISGNRAVFKGTGSMRGQGRYGYVVSVQDAGGRGVNDRLDQLRIRIWDMSRGNAIVYDNFEQAGDIYDMMASGPTIERGNILINSRVVDELLASNASGAMADPDRLKPLEVYPNPAQTQTKIAFVLEQEGQYTLNLYDLKGALVKELRQGQAAADTRIEVEVDVTDLARGIYLAQLSSGDGNKAIRLVVDK